MRYECPTPPPHSSWRSIQSTNNIFLPFSSYSFILLCVERERMREKTVRKWIWLAVASGLFLVRHVLLQVSRASLYIQQASFLVILILVILLYAEKWRGNLFPSVFYFIFFPFSQAKVVVILQLFYLIFYWSLFFQLWLSGCARYSIGFYVARTSTITNRTGSSLDNKRNSLSFSLSVREVSTRCRVHNVEFSPAAIRWNNKNQEGNTTEKKLLLLFVLENNNS